MKSYFCRIWVKQDNIFLQGNTLNKASQKQQTGGGKPLQPPPPPAQHVRKTHTQICYKSAKLSSAFLCPLMVLVNSPERGFLHLSIAAMFILRVPQLYDLGSRVDLLEKDNGENLEAWAQRMDLISFLISLAAFIIFNIFFWTKVYSLD